MSKHPENKYSNNDFFNRIKKKYTAEEFYAKIREIKLTC